MAPFTDVKTKNKPWPSQDVLKEEIFVSACHLLRDAATSAIPS